MLSLTALPKDYSQYRYAAPAYELAIPYSRSQIPWAHRILAAAPLTAKGHLVRRYGHFRQPVPEGDFTLVLAAMQLHMRSGMQCHEYAKHFGLHPASPYHLLDALEYLGSIKQRVEWVHLAGPGILASDPSTKDWVFGERAHFGVWYPEGKDACCASLMPDRYGLKPLTFFAFVKEPWQAKQAA